MSKIFEMFHQGQIDGQRVAGLGLGLSIVKTIAELHEGHVWAESAGAGRGSRFVVDLPLCHSPSIEKIPQTFEVHDERLRMLLVEDNADVRTMLTVMFSWLAYNVIPAASGGAGLDAKEIDRSIRAEIRAKNS